MNGLSDLRDFFQQDAERLGSLRGMFSLEYLWHSSRLLRPWRQELLDH